MSHFTVLVIGPDPEGQLARYDENLEVEPYVAACGECNGDPKWQPCEECDDLGKATTTSNPEGMWDYYRMGGRYAGFLRLLPGATGTLADKAWEYTFNGADDTDWTGLADQALRGAVDLERIKAECWEGECPYRTYAVVAEGAWKGRGEMGWFGVSHGETLTDLEWVAWWDRLVEGLPDNMLLTVFDCHV